VNNAARVLGFVMIAALASTAAAEEILPDVNGPYFTPNLFEEDSFNFFIETDDAYWDSNPYYVPYYDYYETVVYFSMTV
jgi:hypothetical protein